MERHAGGDEDREHPLCENKAMDGDFHESRELAPSLEALLVAMSGGAIDIEQLEQDMDEVANLARLVARLWEFPVVDSMSPPLHFSPSWGEF
jgi:hypothetical protein